MCQIVGDWHACAPRHIMSLGPLAPCTACGTNQSRCRFAPPVLQTNLAKANQKVVAAKVDKL